MPKLKSSNSTTIWFFKQYAILASFNNSTVLPDRSLLIRQKLLEKPKLKSSSSTFTGIFKPCVILTSFENRQCYHKKKLLKNAKIVTLRTLKAASKASRCLLSDDFFNIKNMAPDILRLLFIIRIYRSKLCFFFLELLVRVVAQQLDYGWFLVVVM